MKITILTLFPEFFHSPLHSSIMKRAKEGGAVEIKMVNIRDFTEDKHKTADDRPFGGGCGMLMKPEPIFNAVNSLERSVSTRIIFPCPTGETFNQQKAQALASERELIFICGHYEGVDERVRQYLVTDEISVGDYVLTGGEPATMIIIDALVRLLPGVLGNEDSAQEDSFSDGLLDCPHYTRPREYQGWQVPEVLLSGNHALIEEWRLRQKLKLTWERRPDLLKHKRLDKKTYKLLQEIIKEQNHK